MSLEFIVAIPARHASSRLPGKPLLMIGEAPMIVHVAHRALAAGAAEVWVAADDPRIAEALADTPVRVAMTSSAHASGSDRLAECADIAGWPDEAVVVNLQGDEPFAPVAGIRAVASALVASGASMSTLATRIEDVESLFDPNTVKLVCGGLAPQGWADALYFSRAPVPWHRDALAADRCAMPPGLYLRHIGIYAYRAAFLRRFASMPAGRLEQIESLEQLRVLEAGLRIAVAMTPEPFPPGVDTAEDLERARQRVAGGDA